MAGHISRLADRYTPTPQEQEGEGGVSTGIENLLNKLRKNVLEKINQCILRRLKVRFVKWRANSGQAAEKIAGRLGDEMDETEYEALLKQGASRIIHELCTRSLHRKLEIVFYKWKDSGKQALAT